MILHTSMLAMMALTGFIILSRNNQSTSRASNIIGKALLMVLMAGTFVFMLANGIGTEKFSVGGGVELSVSGVSKIGNMSEGCQFLKSDYDHFISASSNVVFYVHSFSVDAKSGC